MGALQAGGGWLMRYCPGCDEMRPDDTFREGIDAHLCFRCRVSSVQFEGVSEQAIAIRQKDRDFVKDSEAYWRMRKEGKQPRGIDKSAMAEKLATHPIELEIGRSLHKSERDALVRMNGTI